VLEVLEARLSDDEFVELVRGVLDTLG